MNLAPEGRPFVWGGLAILIALVGAGLLWKSWWWLAAGIWLPVTLWVPWFFRDPSRDGPRGDTLVLAPADGRVIAVDQISEPDFVGSEAWRISIFMNVFDVHVNRHPVSGTVTYREYRPGRFFNASLDKASVHNERMSLGITSRRNRFLIRQIAGLVARRIVSDPVEGEQVKQGERLGIIRFGSRVDLFLPSHAAIRAQVGERAAAGLTVVAEIES